MVVVSKKDGKSWRNANFQPINKYYMRQTHHAPPLFDVVGSIP